MTQPKLTEAQQALLRELDKRDGTEDHYIRAEAGTPEFNDLEKMRENRNREAGLESPVTLAKVEQAYCVYSFHDPAISEITVEYASDECRMLETLFRKPYELAIMKGFDETTRTYRLRVLFPGTKVKVNPGSKDWRICETLRKSPYKMAALEQEVSEVRFYRINDAGREVAAMLSAE